MVEILLPLLTEISVESCHPADDLICGGGRHLWGGADPDDETIWEKTPLVWQVPMAISPSMPVGQFVVGAFAQLTILFSRKVLTIEVAFQNEEDFLKNLVCLRGELRSGLAVPVPAGVLKGARPAGSLMAQAANGPHAAQHANLKK